MNVCDSLDKFSFSKKLNFITQKFINNFPCRGIWAGGGGSGKKSPDSGRAGKERKHAKGLLDREYFTLRDLGHLN